MFTEHGLHEIFLCVMNVNSHPVLLVHAPNMLAEMFISYQSTDNFISTKHIFPSLNTHIIIQKYGPVVVTHWTSDYSITVALTPTTPPATSAPSIGSCDAVLFLKLLLSSAGQQHRPHSSLEIPHKESLLFLTTLSV